MKQKKPAAAKQTAILTAAEAEALADRLRDAFPKKGLVERRMFGGIGFMLNGHMIAGASKRGLMLRVGKENYLSALDRPGARPMEMGGRPVEGYIRIDPREIGDVALKEWIGMAVDFVRTLPAKA